MTLAKVVAQLVLAIEHLTAAGAGVERSVVLSHVAAILFAAAEGSRAAMGTLKLVPDGYLLSEVIVELSSGADVGLRLKLRLIWGRERAVGLGDGNRVRDLRKQCVLVGTMMHAIDGQWHLSIPMVASLEYDPSIFR
jgi:hypothetical protein